MARSSHASLIIPALAAYGRSAPLRTAYWVGVGGYASGLALSAMFDQPSGGLVVWTPAACGLLARASRWVLRRLLRRGT